jgi:hypothetical protein
MISDKMRRRLKRRGKKDVYGASLQDADDRVSVSSPPRLRRDGVNISSNREFVFNLEETSPVIDTDDFGGGTISTVTNDVAFRDKAFRCGFDNSEYIAIMQQQQQQSQLSRKKDKPYLQLQTVGQESGVGCINFGTNTGTTKKTSESPMGVNELDSSQFEWADFDSYNKGSNAKQDPAATLNLRKNSKKDDDSFFYSESAPSLATNDTKLVGETITLGSSSSYLNSFDILDDRNEKIHIEQPNQRADDTYQLGMSRGSPVKQPSPNVAKRRDSPQTHQTKEVNSTAPPSPPPQAPRRQSKNPKDDVITDDSSKSGCTVPDIVLEIVDDVKSVLSQVISMAYMACSEGEQCLSNCQDDEPKPHSSQLTTIEEGFSAPVPESSSFARADESKRSMKPWSGDYLSNRTGTEETAENSSQEVDGIEKKQGSGTNRLRKFLASFKSHR